MSEMTVGFSRYVEAAIDCLRGVSHEEIENVATILRETFEADAQILIAGNGGSASISSHLACDLSKTTLARSHDRTRPRVRAIALTDNVPLLTAWANDVRYEIVFAEQVRTLARHGDTLLVISGSGNSPNILAALEAARESGLRRVALLGFDGGRAKALVDSYVHVRSSDYGHVEIAHSMIAHLLTSWLATHVAR